MGGRNDTYGSARAAQPGRSQGRPPTNTGSQPTQQDRPAHPASLPAPLSRTVAPKPTTPRSTSDDEIKGTGGATAFHTGYEQATNSPKRELKIFTAREGGVEHVNSDDQPNAARFTADWVAETFATATA